MLDDPSATIADRLADLVEAHGLDGECQAALRDLLEAARSDDGPLSPEHEQSRYGARWFIGEGASSEVFRVYDSRLRRPMVMKVLKPKHASQPLAVSRFIAEAQISAQLEHPNMVPVHDLGQGPDGQLYFTMREVVGETLKEVIAEVHEASRGERWRSASDWTLRRLVDALHQISRAVAYAHARGIIHRDLKPHNIMIGDFGEVLLLDWGLARSLEIAAEPQTDGYPVTTDRDLSDGFETVHGAITGTPAYMAPEQARGDLSLQGPASDVYALGAILYEILSGRPPYDGPTGWAILAETLKGPPPPLARVCALPVPRALVAICERAMSREPEARYPDGAAFAAALQSWLMDLTLQRDQSRDDVAVVSPGRPATPSEADAVLAALREPIWSELLRDDPSGIFWLEDGQVLCEVGDVDRRAWLLLDGALEIVLENATLIEDRECAFIGEIGLFASAPRTATVRSSGGAWVRAFDPASFERFAGRNPAVALRLIRTLAERLVNAPR